MSIYIIFDPWTMSLLNTYDTLCQIESSSWSPRIRYLWGRAILRRSTLRDFDPILTLYSSVKRLAWKEECQPNIDFLFQSPACVWIVMRWRIWQDLCFSVQSLHSSLNINALRESPNLCERKEITRYVSSQKSSLYFLENCFTSLLLETPIQLHRTPSSQRCESPSSVFFRIISKIFQEMAKNKGRSLAFGWNKSMAVGKKLKW